MGKCVHCGESAGFLKKSHPECANRVRKAKREITELCRKAALHGEGLDNLSERVRTIASRARMPMDSRQLKRTLSQGWGSALEEALIDDHLSDEEILGLNRYRAKLGLTERDLNYSDHFNLFQKALVLGYLHEGIIPRFHQKRSRLPFNLMKSEEMLSIFNNVEYAKEVTRRHYQGSSMGASVRVAKGVYIRPGSFQGRTVEETSMEKQDTGTMGLTTKHLYFAGDNSHRSFRVKLEKIVSFKPYEDGLRIMRDTASAKPEMFIMSPTDAWFLINSIYAVLDIDKVSLPKDNDPTLDELLEKDHDYDDDIGGLLGGFHSLS